MTPRVGAHPRAAELAVAPCQETHPPRRVGREMEFREHGGLPQAAGPRSSMAENSVFRLDKWWTLAVHYDSVQQGSAVAPMCRIF